jgi:general secretion pathway protein E
MGVEPFLVASSLEGVIAQRLVRRICQNCKTEYEITDVEKAQITKMTHLEPINLEGKKLFKGTGCEECMNTGYKGRIAICEVMEVNEDLRSVISKSPESNIVKQEALNSGMKTLVKDGIEKALKGITTLEEVIQATKV